MKYADVSDIRGGRTEGRSSKVRVLAARAFKGSRFMMKARAAGSAINDLDDRPTRWTLLALRSSYIVHTNVPATMYQVMGAKCAKYAKHSRIEGLVGRSEHMK